MEILFDDGFLFHFDALQTVADHRDEDQDGCRYAWHSEHHAPDGQGKRLDEVQPFVGAQLHDDGRRLFPVRIEEVDSLLPVCCHCDARYGNGCFLVTRTRGRGKEWDH